MFCPRGAARSARLPVTQEIVGSNPIEDAGGDGTVRKSEKRPSSNLGESFVGSTPTRVTYCKFNKVSRRLGMGVPRWP